jgi:hypothetical protein
VNDERDFEIYSHVSNSSGASDETDNWRAGGITVIVTNKEANKKNKGFTR